MAFLEVAKWPLVVLILAGAALVYLLPQVRGFLGRLTKLKYKDTEATAEQALAAVSAQAVTGTPGNPAAPHPFESGDHAYIRSTADRLAGQVGAMQFSSPAERDRWLFREGARQAVAIEFERIYRIVWASQMELLGGANKIGGVPTEAARARYQAMAHDVPAVYSTYPFEKWIGFLENFGLISREGDKFITTPKGSLFVQYLMAMHYDLHGLRHDL